MTDIPSPTEVQDQSEALAEAMIAAMQRIRPQVEIYVSEPGGFDGEVYDPGTVTISATLDGRVQAHLNFPNDGNLDMEGSTLLLSLFPQIVIQALQQLEEAQDA